MMSHTLDNRSFCCTSEIVVGSTQFLQYTSFTPPGLKPIMPIPISRVRNYADIGNILSGKVDWVQGEEESFTLFNGIYITSCHIG